MIPRSFLPGPINEFLDARRHREKVREVLESECEREAYVEDLVNKLEDAKRRNHFGESMRLAMSRRS